MQFYREKLSYKVDAISPSQCGDNRCVYEILNKPLVSLSNGYCK